MNNPFLEIAELQFLQGDDAAALRTVRMGLALSPDHAGLLEIAATCAGRQGDDAYAADCWQALFVADPSAIHALNSLALARERLGQAAAAEVAYRQALELLPDDANLHANLGLLLEKSGRLDAAETHQRRAVALAPDSAEIHSNLAALLARTGRETEAESLYRMAIRLDPAFATAHSNLGVLLVDTGREAEAEASFREALRLQPDYLQGRMNLAQLLLMQGRLAEGWPLYESRQQVYVEAGSGPAVHLPPCPQWQGEPLAGKSIVVLPEQGMGDEIQFVRYLAWLKAQGPARLTLVCRAAQKALLQTLAGPDVVLELAEAAPCLAEHDYWVFLLSLPLHAGTTLATIPATTPYLFADPQRHERFAPLLAGEGLRVGVVWRGNPLHSNDADRSLPGLETLAPLWAIAGVRFFSLQKSPLELPPLPAGQPLVDLGPQLGDFADTAAALVGLDLLVTVDTSVAHLAGALGVPCWVLLPAYKSDWRWQKGQSDSPWYPSLRLFWQTQRGDWAGPVAEVAAAVQDFLREGQVA